MEKQPQLTVVWPQKKEPANKSSPSNQAVVK